MLPQLSKDKLELLKKCSTVPGAFKMFHQHKESIINYVEDSENFKEHLSDTSSLSVGSIVFLIIIIIIYIVFIIITIFLIIEAFKIAPWFGILILVLMFINPLLAIIIFIILYYALDMKSGRKVDFLKKRSSRRSSKRRASSKKSNNYSSTRRYGSRVSYDID